MLGVTAASTPAGLAVLPVEVSPEHGPRVARELVPPVQEAASNRLDLDPLPEEALFALAGDLADPIVHCGSDRGCLASRLSHLTVRFGVVVVLNRFVDPPILSLTLIDAESKRVAGESSGSVVEERLHREVRRRAAEVFDSAGLPEAARLVLSVKPPNAALTIDGARVTPGEHRLPPGKHVVEATEEDHLPVRRQLELVPGKGEEISLALEKRASVWSSPWFWVGLAAAAVAAAGTVTAVTLTSGSSECLCVTGEASCPRSCP